MLPMPMMGSMGATGNGGVRSLGPELLVNGDFEAGSANWAVTNADATHIITFAGGTMRYQSDTITPVLGLSQTPNVVLTFNKVYLITADVLSGGGLGLVSDRFGGAIVVAPTPGIGSKLLTCLSTGPLNLYRQGVNVDLTLNSLSVKEFSTL